MKSFGENILKNIFKCRSKQICNEVIDKLKQEGHQIYIITARGSFLSHSADVMSIEENQQIVLNWLKNNHINMITIIFSPEDKLDICKENNIDLMIEDKVDNINKISKIIPVICFHAGYNKDCKNSILLDVIVGMIYIAK